VSLRGHPVSESAVLPDGRPVAIDVRLFDDEYVEGRSTTVMVELTSAGEVLASVNTVLEPEQTSEARELAREIRAGLESGELAPTAGALEPLADALR
jgi:hypothetical protein